jgi:tetratricopeptide (TPR) repeat protein
MPMVEAFVAVPFAIAVRCGDWDDLISAQEPAAQTPTLKAFWLYGRGIALANHGKAVEAEDLEKQLAKLEQATSPDDLYMPPVENHTRQIFHIAHDVLAARIAAGKGDKAAATKLLRDAVATQDQLLYDEPQDWYYPVRETLGGMLLRENDLKGAEEVFRKDLEQNPRNPRSLFGLAETLTRQHRDYEASWIKQQLQSAWQGADVELKSEDL